MKLEKEKIYTYINQELKTRYGDKIRRVYIDIDEKNKEINVLVITKKLDPDLETKIFDFEDKFEKENKISSRFRILPELSAAGSLI